MPPDPATTYLVHVYVAYAVLAVSLTVWLARTLFRNGAVFLEDVFKDAPKMAAAVNRLLVVGFYLLNLGYAALIMKTREGGSPVEAMETLAYKMGALLVSLGLMHFLNMYVFFRIRRRSRVGELPSTAPQAALYAPVPAGAARHPMTTPAPVR